MRIIPLRSLANGNRGATLIAVMMIILVLSVMAASVYLSSSTTQKMIKKHEEEAERKELLRKEMDKFITYLQVRYLYTTRSNIDPSDPDIYYDCYKRGQAYDPLWDRFVQAIPFCDETNYFGLMTGNCKLPSGDIATPTQCKPDPAGQAIVNISFAADTNRKNWMSNRLGNSCFLNDDPTTCGGYPSYSYFVKRPVLYPDDTIIATWLTYADKAANDNNVVMAFSLQIYLIEEGETQTTGVNGIESVLIFHLKCSRKCDDEGARAYWNLARPDKFYVGATRFLSRRTQ